MKRISNTQINKVVCIYHQNSLQKIFNKNIVIISKRNIEKAVDYLSKDIEEPNIGNEPIDKKRRWILGFIIYNIQKIFNIRDKNNKDIDKTFKFIMTPEEELWDYYNEYVKPSLRTKLKKA